MGCLDLVACRLVWELACLRWHHLGVTEKPMCLHRRQASSHMTEFVIATLPVIKKATGPWGRSRLYPCEGSAYCTSTARLSLIFFCQMAGPVMWTDSPLLSTATVTGMSFTSNS